MTPNRAMYGVFKALIMLKVCQRTTRLFVTLKTRLSIEAYDVAVSRINVMHDDHIAYRLWHE